MFGKGVKDGRKPWGGPGLVLAVTHECRVSEASEWCSLCTVLADLTGRHSVLEAICLPAGSGLAGSCMWLGWEEGRTCTLLPLLLYLAPRDSSGNWPNHPAPAAVPRHLKCLPGPAPSAVGTLHTPAKLAPGATFCPAPTFLEQDGAVCPGDYELPKDGPRSSLPMHHP